MKKIATAVFVLTIVGVNVFLLLPKQSPETRADECSALKCPKIELSDMNMGMLPQLLKS